MVKNTEQQPILFTFFGKKWADVVQLPAHRDSTAMNGAQLFKAQCDSSVLMDGPPA
jgi:hypothetical protein